MEKLKTRNEYVGCSRKCRFDADTITATSYGHWDFVKVIKGKVVFNDYNYSSTTSKHQWAIRCLLDTLGIKIDMEVNMHKSLCESAFERYSLAPLYNTAIRLIVQNNTKRVRKKTIENNKKIIAHVKEEIALLKDMGAIYSPSKFKERVRYYKTEREDHEKYIAFKREYKNKVFRDGSNTRHSIRAFNSDGWVTLYNYDTNREHNVFFERMLQRYAVCPLSTILDGAA